MRKVHLIFLFIIFLAFQSCKTVSNRVDKTISEEEKKLSKFLNKTTEELKIEFGEPDLIETTNKENKNFVYLKSKLKIKCERRFEINPEKIVIGFVSNGCF